MLDVGKEQMPTVIAPESFQAHQGFVPGTNPGGQRETPASTRLKETLQLLDSGVNLV